MEEIQTDQNLGAAPSLVQHFSIEGLYGYKSIGFSSEYAATILIAKNGSGKTTVLGALDAFLKGQFGRLSGLEFSQITCKLRGIDEMLVLTKADVISSISIADNSLIAQYSKHFGISPHDLLDFIENDYVGHQGSLNSLYGENAIWDTVLQKCSFEHLESKKVCDMLVSSLAGRNANVDFIRNSIKTVIGKTEIVYLPTYRRIELSLPDEEDKNKRAYKKKVSVRNRLGISRHGLFNADIQFGLSDISERLEKLNKEILFTSTESYRSISANIINELIDNAFERENPSPAERPDKAALNLFFSRLRQGKTMRPYGDVAIPNIDKIYSGQDISTESSKFLTYFLGKLNTVIKATRDVELMVEDFISHCNRYLTSSELSARSIDKPSPTSAMDDDKILRLDRKNLQVKVRSLTTGKRIPFDSLSSGEKQIISLFARIYLYSGPKIILIDEPELSLSIDWQRKILVDVVAAASCAQVIAITHSPFVFDNELDPYARGLSASVDVSANQAVLDIGDGYEEEDDDNGEGLNG